MIISQVRKAVLAMISQAMRDPRMETEITYRKFESQGDFDKSKGHPQNDYDEKALTAIKMFHDAKSINFAQPGDLQIGQPVFVFRFDDLPNGISLKDQIKEGDSVYKVSHIQPYFETVALISVEAG